MIKNLILLGSTGSIGETTLNIINKNKNKFKIKLLTTNKQVKKIYKQALKFNVKKIVIFDKNSYSSYSLRFKKKKNKSIFQYQRCFKKRKKKN